MGGAEDEAYAPCRVRALIPRCCITTSFSAKSKDGDIVLMDVAAQYSGYAADITRTVPANGKYTPRQREIL